MNLMGYYLKSTGGTLHASKDGVKYNYTKCGRRLKKAVYNNSPGSVKSFCKLCGITESSVFDPKQWTFNSIGLPAEVDWAGVLDK